IGPGPPTLDIVDPELVELARQGRLVGGGKIHPLRLRAVAQRGVVERDALGGHTVLNSPCATAWSRRAYPRGGCPSARGRCGCGRLRRSSWPCARRCARLSRSRSRSSLAHHRGATPPDPAAASPAPIRPPAARP